MREEVHESYRSKPEHWWFRARRRIFDEFLCACVKLPDPALILDVGPGSGVNLPVLAPRGQVTVLDRDLQSAARCHIGATKPVVGDAQALPFADQSFDLTCGLDVVEHLDDDFGAMRELYRVTKPGGHVLISVPAFGMLWGRQDVLSEHRRRYGRGQLQRLLRDAGFEIERLSYFNSLLFLPILAARVLARPFLARSVRRQKSDLDVVAPFGLDKLLYWTFACEAWWLPRHNLPIGVSLIALGRRPA